MRFYSIIVMLGMPQKRLQRVARFLRARREWSDTQILDWFEDIALSR